MPSWPRFFKIRKTWSFHVVVWQRTATKCTKIYNARAQLLFCSLNLLFGDVPVAVAVVVCLSSLTMRRPQQLTNSSVVYHKTKNPFGVNISKKISFKLLLYIMKVESQEDQ